MKRSWRNGLPRDQRNNQSGMALVTVFVMITLATILFSVFAGRTINKAQGARDLKSDQAADRMIESAVERLNQYFQTGLVYYYCSGLPGPETCTFKFDATAPASVVASYSGGQFVFDQVNSVAQSSDPSWSDAFASNATPTVPTTFRSQVVISVDAVHRSSNAFDITARVNSGPYNGMRRSRISTAFRRRCGVNPNVARSYLNWGPGACAASPNYSWGRTNTVDLTQSYIEYQCLGGAATAPGTWDFHIKVANGDATGPSCGWTYGQCGFAERISGTFNGDLNLGYFGGCTGGGSMSGMSLLPPTGPGFARVLIGFTANTTHLPAAGHARIEVHPVCTCS